MVARNQESQDIISSMIRQMQRTKAAAEALHGLGWSDDERSWLLLVGLSGVSVLAQEIREGIRRGDVQGGRVLPSVSVLAGGMGMPVTVDRLRRALATLEEEGYVIRDSRGRRMLALPCPDGLSNSTDTVPFVEVVDLAERKESDDG